MLNVRLTLPFDKNYFANEAFSTLSTNIRLSGPDTKVITVTSCYENEGKTSVAFLLAKHLAADHSKRVLLIDADMRKSVAVSRFTDLTGARGLSELISGMAKSEDVLYRSDIEGLDLIFSGAVPPNPVSLLGHSAFSDLIRSHAAGYDYVLIDTPPISPVVDATLAASASDGVLFVVNRQTVRRKNLLAAKEQLEQNGHKVIGVVLNDSPRPRQKKIALLFSRLLSLRKR